MGGDDPWEGGRGDSRPHRSPRCHFSFLWPVTADKWDRGRGRKKKTSEVSAGRGGPLRGPSSPRSAKRPRLRSTTPGAVRVNGGRGAGQRARGAALGAARLSQALKPGSDPQPNVPRGAWRHSGNRGSARACGRWHSGVSRMTKLHPIG